MVSRAVLSTVPPAARAWRAARQCRLLRPARRGGRNQLPSAAHLDPLELDAQVAVLGQDPARLVVHALLVVPPAARDLDPPAGVVVVQRMEHVAHLDAGDDLALDGRGVAPHGHLLVDDLPALARALLVLLPLLLEAARVLQGGRGPRRLLLLALALQPDGDLQELLGHLLHLRVHAAHALHDERGVELAQRQRLDEVLDHLGGRELHGGPAGVVQGPGVRALLQQHHDDVDVVRLRGVHHGRVAAGVRLVEVHAGLDELPRVEQVALHGGHAQRAQGLSLEGQALRPEEGPQLRVVQHHPAYAVAPVHDHAPHPRLVPVEHLHGRALPLLELRRRRQRGRRADGHLPRHDVVEEALARHLWRKLRGRLDADALELRLALQLLLLLELHVVLRQRKDLHLPQELLLLEGHADPAAVGAVAHELVVAHAVAHDLQLPDAGAEGQALHEALGAGVLLLPHHDAALVLAADDLPVPVVRAHLRLDRRALLHLHGLLDAPLVLLQVVRETTHGGGGREGRPAPGQTLVLKGSWA
mmetsp:Transcript_27898/g.88663  ORF Transcript_27898/g.88663 Transcript_27898/m.88663 type:complete len:530 (-) Transcript_27898:11-1600(-)